MAVTTAFKRASLRAAFERTKADPSHTLRDVLAAEENTARSAIERGSVVSTSSGSSSVALSESLNSVSQRDIAAMWTELLDEYGRTRRFLLRCARFGEDAWVAERIGNASVTQVDSPVTRDTEGAWADLCDEHEVPAVTVVGIAVSDAAIYLWMLTHLQPVAELHYDFTEARL